jgi:hemolysin activation/secretion protein
MLDYNIGVAHNLALGTHYTNVDGTIDRYSYLTSGNRSTRDDFNILRLGGSYLKAFQSDWQVRVAASGQYTGDPLVAAEQLGLAGSTAVRGFNERAVSTDSGYFANTEIYTPELSKKTGMPGSLRALAFYDFAHGYNRNLPAGSLTPGSIGIASIGAGVRYAMGKNFSLRFDLARVLDAGPANPVPGTTPNISSKERGDWRGHLNVMIGF